MREQRPCETLRKTRVVGEIVFEAAPSRSDQVIADVRAAVGDAVARRALAGAFERAQRDAELRLAAGRRERFDGAALTIAAQEIHAAVDAGRIAAQRLFDRADRFEIFAPVEHRAEAQAGDGVRHRDLGHGLSLMHFADRVLGAALPGREMFLDRCADGSEAQPVLADAMEQLDQRRYLEH